MAARKLNIIQEKPFHREERQEREERQSTGIVIKIANLAIASGSILAASALLILCTFVPTLTFAQVNVNLPWVRATAQAQKSAAVYMKLEAHVTSSIALVGASSPLAKSAEIRAARNSMRKTNAVRLEIPAGSSVLLKPGASHVMLIGLTQSLKKGESVPLKLDFETNDAARFSVNITAAIVSADAKSALDHHHH